MNKKWIANIALLLTAMIWGFSIAIQRMGMEYVEPITFTSLRFVFSFLTLLPIIYYVDKKKGKKEMAPQEKKNLLLGGFLCGLFLFAGSCLQQIGMISTPAGKTGFITSLYIVLVPILGLFFHKKVSINVWFGVGLSLAGLYLLCVKDTLAFAAGDYTILLGTFFLAAHIVCVGIFSPKVDPLRFACLQYLFCAIFCAVPGLLTEQNTWQGILQCAIPILYAGILSGGVGFTCQILAQRFTDATVVSLIISLESVFSAVAGFLLLQELLSARELMGCALMFCGVIVAQLQGKKAIRQKGEISSLPE